MSPDPFLTHYFSHPGDISITCVQAPKRTFLHEKSDWLPVLQNLFNKGRRMPTIRYSVLMPDHRNLS
jgi:hypothetical protein